MAVRRGVPAHLRHRSLRRRRPILDRLPLRRPRGDRRARRHPDRRAGAAARHLHLPRRARRPQRRRHLPRRRRAHRNPHVVANRLEHAARPVRPDRAVHIRHRPREGSGQVAGRSGRRLCRHRPGITRLRCGRAADRPHDRRVDSGRAHRRHGVAVLPRPAPALIGGAHRHLDGSTRSGTGERRRRRVRRRSPHPRRETRAAERVQRRLPHPRAGKGATELLV